MLITKKQQNKYRRDMAIKRAIQCSKEASQKMLDEMGIDRETLKEWLVGVAKIEYSDDPEEDARRSKECLEILDRLVKQNV